MDLTLDIFKNNAFSVTSLQRVAGGTPYMPQALGSMQLFTPRPILTEDVLLYEEDGGFALIPTTNRGGPDIQQIRRMGRMRALKTVRLSKKDTVRAGELMGVASTALPESVRLVNAQQLTTDRTAQLKTDMEATKEFHRLGALRGKLFDADGVTLLVDFFAEYGIAAPAVINFNFAAIPANGLAVYIAQNVRDPIIDTLKENGRLTPNARIGALVGDAFWYALIQHVDIVKRYELQETARYTMLAANPLLTAPRHESITIAGVTFMHYEGAANGSIDVTTNEAIFFPIGAKDVFDVYWSPGETLLDVADPGRPEYLYVQPDPNDRMPTFVDITLRAYPLYACTFPKALLAGLKV